MGLKNFKIRNKSNILWQNIKFSHKNCIFIFGNSFINGQIFKKVLDKKIQLIILVGLVILVSLFYCSGILYAQEKWEPMIEIPGQGKPSSFGGYVVAIYNFMFNLVGIVAMLMIIIGGFRYMTSTGNASAMADAKDMIFNAILGLCLALLSWLILYTINPDLINLPTRFIRY
jgi:hypothetical protein